MTCCRLQFDSADRADTARLLHELVHYVQWANGRHQSTCLGELELEAYDLQDRWRKQQASTDEFKCMTLAASCEA